MPAYTDAEILSIVQKLRSELDIRDRTFRLRVYKNCFIGSDAVTYVTHAGIASTRKEGVALMQKLLKAKLLHHVVDDHAFQDKYLFYRFYVDEDEDKKRFWARGLAAENAEDFCAAVTALRFSAHECIAEGDGWVESKSRGKDEKRTWRKPADGRWISAKASSIINAPPRAVAAHIWELPRRQRWNRLVDGQAVVATAFHSNTVAPPAEHDRFGGKLGPIVEGDKTASAADKSNQAAGSSAPTNRSGSSGGTAAKPANQGSGGSTNSTASSKNVSASASPSLATPPRIKKTPSYGSLEDRMSSVAIGSPGASEVTEVTNGQLWRPRIIYRRMKPITTLARARDACLFQDWFEIREGVFVVYEVSVQHKMVPPTSDCLRGEVLASVWLVEAAGPLRGASAASSGKSTGKAAAAAADSHHDSQGSSGTNPDHCRSRVTTLIQMDLRGRMPTFMINAVTEKLSWRLLESLAEQFRSASSLGAEAPMFEGIPIASYDANDDEDGDAPPGTPGAEDAVRSECSMRDFEVLAVLGRGGYGKVLQVRHKQTKVVYAMKVLRKKDLVARKQVERTMTERLILESVRHPFTVGLKMAFQSPYKLYMVLDFVAGGDMFTLLSRQGALPEPRARLYAAQILLAFRHLHGRGVVYRDLKPENIMIDADGHVRLTDFGLSRVTSNEEALAAELNKSTSASAATPSSASDSSTPRAILSPRSAAGARAAQDITHSFCGTEQYMAPEVLLQRGHDNRVDFWCLGIIISEMLTGKHPFRGRTHYETLKNIVHPNTPPSTLKHLSPNAADIVSRLLAKDPSARLGSAEHGGIRGIMRHPFFEALNWEDVESLKTKPDWKPKVRGLEDISNFDHVFTREAAIDSVADGSIALPNSKQLAKGGSGNDSGDSPAKGGFFGSFFRRMTSKKSKRRMEESADTGTQQQVEQSAANDSDPLFPGFEFRSQSVFGGGSQAAESSRREGSDGSGGGGEHDEDSPTAGATAGV